MFLRLANLERKGNDWVQWSQVLMATTHLRQGSHHVPRLACPCACCPFTTHCTLTYGTLDWRLSCLCWIAHGLHRSGYCPWFQALRRTTRWVILRRQKGDSAWSAAVEASWTMAGARTSVEPFGQSAVFNQISAGLRTKPFLPENITCFYSSTILLASLWKAVLGPPSANFELSFRLVYDTGFLCGALAVLAFTM